MIMRFALFIAAISALVVITSCSKLGSPELTASQINLPEPNRGSPGPYDQSVLEIPKTLNDPLYLSSGPWSEAKASYLWSFDDMSAFPAFGKLTLPPSEIIVAVIDTGVDKDHEDLAGRLWINHAEYDGGKFINGRDNDGDGFVNDYLGWDFVHGTNNPADDVGHGTHVAGTIAAVGNNAKGIVGVSPWVRIMPLKVCDDRGECSSSDIRAALAFAVAHGAKIANISLGGYDPGSADSDAFDQAIRAATDAGTLVVVSAGNSIVDVGEITPANSTNAVAVVAHRNDGGICSFSDFGWKVDLSAPGCALKSGVDSAGVLSLNSRKCGIAGNEYCSSKNTVGQGYLLKAGTSMAAPHISGLAALAWTASPNATPLQIRQALLRSSRGTAAHTKDFNFGAGRASATNLVDEARTAPGLKIRSPRYGATSNTHDIEMRIEARDRPVHWQLKYVAEMNFAGLDLATGVLIGAGGDVPAGTSVTPHQSWSPPETGNFVVILEATVNGEKYYDTTLLRSP